MPQDRIKDLSELKDIDPFDFRSNELPKNWSFSLGRNGLDRNQWCITFTHEDLSQDVYPLPLFVSVLVNWKKNSGREEVRNEIKRTLGL